MEHLTGLLGGAQPGCGLRGFVGCNWEISLVPVG